MTVSVDTTSQTYTTGPQPTPTILCLHTTEGMSWPDYNGGAYAPHATVKAIPGKGISVREHIPRDQYAKALVNAPGGVQTNTRGVWQIELVGTCDERHQDDPAWYFWPDADPVVLASLAEYLRPRMGSIPLTCGVTFKAYNRGMPGGSYGKNNGVRLSFEQWNGYTGVLGHENVPENDHGDPGAFPINTLIALLRNERGFLMALTNEQQERLYRNVEAIAKAVPGLLNDADGAYIIKNIAYIRDQILGALNPERFSQAIIDALPAGSGINPDDLTRAVEQAFAKLDLRITAGDQ